jgi:hypothetical protein
VYRSADTSEKNADDKYTRVLTADDNGMRKKEAMHETRVVNEDKKEEVQVCVRECTSARNYRFVQHDIGFDARNQ